MYFKVYNHSCSCVCPSAKCDVGHATEWLEYSLIPQRSFGFKDCWYANFQHIKTEKDGHFQILYSGQLNAGMSVQSCNSIKSCVPSDNISLNRRFFSQD